MGHVSDKVNNGHNIENSISSTTVILPLHRDNPELFVEVQC